MLRHTLLLMILLAAVVDVACWAGQARAADMPPISGMALIEGRDFLAVVDTKAGVDAPRAGIISVGEAGGYTFTPLVVDWPGAPANDLESACAIPDRPGEFIVSESGAWTDRTTGAEHIGRIFHLEMKHDGGNWTAHVINTLELPRELKEVEGMACMGSNRLETDRQGESHENIVADPVEYSQLILGARGGNTPFQPALLYYAYANLDSGTWASSDYNSWNPSALRSTYIEFPWIHGISDLYWDGGEFIWVSEAVDPGDGGAFFSHIYAINTPGFFEPNFDNYCDFYGYWNISGLKVEALGAPVIAGSIISIATDDESYGGVWRPLGLPLGTH